MKHFVFALMFSVSALGTVALEFVEPTAAESVDQPSPATAPTHVPSADPVVAITVGATPARTAAVRATVELFSDSGLLLPDLEVRFYDRPDECRGHLGLFQAQFSPARILVCGDLAFILPHELAHAWDIANLDDSDRQQYVEAGGFETWDDQDAERDERGVEDAAFVIQQNLTAINPALSSSTWEQRVGAFELLTGQLSPLLTPRP